MTPTLRQIDRFLRRNRLQGQGVDLSRYCATFLAEMKRGLEGARSSLPMIPTYVETSREVTRGQRVVALDAGGTNMRVAVVSFDPAGKPVVENLTRHRMPGVDETLDRDAFFQALARVVLPTLGDADRIGFCFSYPAEITPDRDGRLIQFTKEIKARGVDGELIGANLGRALKAAGAENPVRIILLNDTVATLLAGRNALPDRRFDGFIGVVCGTGLNVAYVEKNSLIRKTPGLDAAQSQIVNTESGSFARGLYGPVDDAFDATMANPGKYRHEKIISGAYLGALCLFAVRAAAADGCISAPGRVELDRIPGLSTRDLNDYLLHPDDRSNPLGAACSLMPSPDAKAVYRVCDSLVERAAAMIAMNLGAVVLKSGAGQDPRYPACIAVDGTTFWQLRTFRLRVEAHMRRLLIGDRERAWEITAVEDAPLLGAAIAALTN
jgi:hexokinase